MSVYEHANLKARSTNPVRKFVDHPLVQRFVACLFAGFVLALMIGSQEGSQTDFTYAFKQATKPGRLSIFLLIGVAIFFLITYWPAISPYLKHPGAVPTIVGFVAVLAAMALLNWYDAIGKFKPLVSQVSNSNGVPFAPGLFFSGFGWALMVIVLVLGGVAVATRLPVIGYAQAVVAAASAVFVFVAHSQLVTFAASAKNPTPDHSLAVWIACAGYLTFAVGGLVAASSRVEVADSMKGLEAALDWRPGLPMVGAGVVFGVIGFVNAAWFSPQQKNWNFASTHVNFEGAGLRSFASLYLSWLGITLFVVTVVLAAAASFLRHRVLGLVATALGLIGTIWTFTVIYEIAKDGAEVAPQFGARWKNIGAGGWVTCIGFALVFSGAVLCVRGLRTKSARTGPAALQGSSMSSATRNGIAIAIAFALFYPPTLPGNWQNVIVTQIAVYLLLAIGLNVVVGWAGLLDLGYIAFYGIGSYTTAYFTGSLPIKPPSWLHFSPLLAIPFAILACLIAGVLLGAPTLRLRGDYLAIVTLGFGEIVEVVANNNPGNLTGGPIGPNVPHPHINVGPVHVTFGLDNLPYWYLLLFMLGIALFLLFRLEGSRLGRAWAAVREDEVAAEATGVKTTRIKLLAFAIGASTSGVAGVFFASQVGYFDPSQFVLQNSILIVAYVVFGGMGSLGGALAGAAVLTWLPYFLQSQVPLPDSQMWIGAVVMAMMIFRPAGLIPARRRRTELAHLEEAVGSEPAAIPASGAI